MRPLLLLLLLAGCADGYDRAGYKLPGDCAEAARLTADVPVVRTSEHELAHIAGRRVTLWILTDPESVKALLLMIAANEGVK